MVRCSQKIFPGQAFFAWVSPLNYSFLGAIEPGSPLMTLPHLGQCKIRRAFAYPAPYSAAIVPGDLQRSHTAGIVFRLIRTVITTVTSAIAEKPINEIPSTPER